MSNKSHITVFGATGNIGRHLLQLLSAAQLPVIAVTRDAVKATPLPAVQWVSADMSAPASLPATMHDSRAVFLLSGHSPDFVVPCVAGGGERCGASLLARFFTRRLSFSGAISVMP